MQIIVHVLAHFAISLTQSVLKIKVYTPTSEKNCKKRMMIIHKLCEIKYFSEVDTSQKKKAETSPMCSSFRFS